jgi:hypothetical protein
LTLRIMVCAQRLPASQQRRVIFWKHELKIKLSATENIIAIRDVKQNIDKAFRTI